MIIHSRVCPNAGVVRPPRPAGTCGYGSGNWSHRAWNYDTETGNRSISWLEILIRQKHVAAYADRYRFSGALNALHVTGLPHAGPVRMRPLRRRKPRPVPGTGAPKAREGSDDHGRRIQAQDQRPADVRNGIQMSGSCAFRWPVPSPVQSRGCGGRPSAGRSRPDPAGCLTISDVRYRNILERAQPTSASARILRGASGARLFLIVGVVSGRISPNPGVQILLPLGHLFATFYRFFHPPLPPAWLIFYHDVCRPDLDINPFTGGSV